MKKKYEAPAMEIVEIEPAYLLNGSDPASIRIHNDDDDYEEIL